MNDNHEKFDNKEISRYSDKHSETPHEESTKNNKHQLDEPAREDMNEQVERQPKQQSKKKRKGGDEKRMPFLDHLEELRWCLIRSIVGIGIASAGAAVFGRIILNFLMRPYIMLPEEMRVAPMQFLSPAGGFMIRIKVAVFAGLIIALPYVFYEIWKFVVPGLLAKEKKYAPVIIFATTLCFLTGAAFAFFIILPFGLRFLFRFQTDWMVANLRIEDYLSFVMRVIAAFGVVFELPVLSFILTKIGLLTPKFLRSKRRYGIVIVFIIAAILTPPDPLTQLMMATPLLVLYEISIVVSRIVAGKEEKSTDDKKSTRKKKKKTN